MRITKASPASFMARSFLVLASLSVMSCGGGGGGSGSNDGASSDEDAAESYTVSASVMKGPVDGAACELYGISEAGESGDMLASGASVDGAVSFTISETGNHLVVCSGGTYTDEATGATLTAPQLRAVVSTHGDAEVTVSPLTELAVSLAADLNQVDNDTVADAFGLSGVDIAATVPTDLNAVSAADDAAGNYGTVLAIVSQYQSDQGSTLQQALDTLTTDLSDGTFSPDRKTDLSAAATNLSSSSVSGNVNSTVVSDLVSDIQDYEDNTAPVAIAGADVTAPTGSRVDLDGSASSDQDNDSLAYSWTFSSLPQGSAASISNSGSVMPSFVPDVEGDYIVQLMVNDGEDTHSDVVTVTADTKTWVINNSESGAYIDALVNVQSVTETSIGPNAFYLVSASGVPNYSVVMTQADIDVLNSRPEAASDFDNGQTTAQAGDTIVFGEDLGYNITRVGCDLGYWPPGPACPSDQQREARIPASPSPAESDCATSINTMGLMLNGTSLYNWSDGVSYNNESVWRQLAPEFEIYDVDICSGHAQTQGDYHHHMFSPCLAELFGDAGQAHSPIYGYAADGYPVYGPYHAKGVLAKSAWVKRDYSDTNAGGCGDGARSCLLADQYDLSQGVISTNYPGPGVNETVVSNSGNEFVAASGYYYEDYYFDASLTALGNEYLDEHNGHSHDNLGYHYHTTVVDNNGNLEPVFPYNIGPTFYGDTPGGSVYTCQQLP
ncbi:MAG: YHYH protein [Pseudomonadota bacterium]|nr:YHYH protein [Pseudomonadota bacterium]